jgi:hypothetical protein
MGVSVEPPFIISSADVSCTFAKQTGDISFDTLARPGRKRVSLTFETDDNRGYTAQYCFQTDEQDLAEMTTTATSKRYLYSLCEQ